MLMLKSKLRATLGAVMSVKTSLNKSALLVTYHSLFASHVRYCITNCFFGNTTISSQLQNIYNKFIRMTFNLSSKENVLPLMKEHGLLTIEDIFKHEEAVFMFKHHNLSLPRAFDDIFNPKPLQLQPEKIAASFLPSAVILLVNNQSGTLDQKYGILFPVAIRKFRSLGAFKRKLKQHLSSAY